MLTEEKEASKRKKEGDEKTMQVEHCIYLFVMLKYTAFTALCNTLGEVLKKKII